MFYFVYKSLRKFSNTSREDVILKHNQHFQIKEKKKDFYITRERLILRSKIGRILLPKLITRVKIEPNQISYKTRLEGFSFFIFIIYIGGVLVELNWNRFEAEREYPVAFPFAILGLFCLGAILETIKVHKILNSLDSV